MDEKPKMLSFAWMMEKGWGLGKFEKMIIFQLKDGNEKFVSELVRELNRKYPNENFNPVTVKEKLNTLKEGFGMVDTYERNFKIYARITPWGMRYINSFPRLERLAKKLEAGEKSVKKGLCGFLFVFRR